MGSSLCDHFMRLYKGHLLCLYLGKPYAGPRLLGEFPFLHGRQFCKLKIHKKLKILMWRAAVRVLPMWHNLTRFLELENTTCLLCSLALAGIL